MLHIVLFQPEIAPNTGNIGRLCALTRSRLHLIHPLGYKITDKNLKRAGMDYWKSLDVHEHADWAAFRASPHAPKRLWLFTTKTEQSFWAVRFADGDGLVLGGPLGLDNRFYGASSSHTDVDRAKDHLCQSAPCFLETWNAAAGSE